jgi:hypothetical protein
LETQKKNSNKKNTVKTKNKFDLFLKQTVQKIITFFSVLFKNSKKWLLFVGSKIKIGAQFIYKKIKLAVIFLLKKCKLLFKKIALRFKVIPLSIKIVFASILLLSVAGLTTHFIVSHQKNLNLSSYNLLNEAVSYEIEFLENPQFFTLQQVEEPLRNEVSNKAVLFEAMQNNYIYYVNALKSIQNANNNMREQVNNGLEQLGQQISLLQEEYEKVETELQKTEPSEAYITQYYNQILSGLENIILNSQNLLPQLENYIQLFGQLNVENKLSSYLIRLQFHYASALITEAQLGQDISTQLADLNSIIQKSDAFLGTSSSIYKDSFIEAYENYNAYNYYKAQDKYIFKSSTSLTEQEKVYARDFYNFLMQANYN